MKKNNSFLKGLLGGFFLLALGFQSLAWADAGAVPVSTPSLTPPITPLISEGIYIDRWSTTTPVTHLAMKVGNLGGRSPSAVTCEYYTATHLVASPPVSLGSPSASVEPIWITGKITHTSNNSYICEPVYVGPTYAINLASSAPLGMRVSSTASGDSSSVTVTNLDAPPTIDTDLPLVNGFSISGDYYVAPGVGGIKYFGSSINLSVNAGDTSSGIRNCSYQLADPSVVDPVWLDIVPKRTSLPGTSETALCLVSQLGVTQDHLNIAMSAKDNVWNSAVSEIISAQGDHTKPLSHVGTLDATQTTSSFNVSFTFSDGGTVSSGVKNAQMYYRYRNNSSATWTDWSAYGAAVTASPIPFMATMGNGDYEFYTRATDNVNNVEDAPAAASARTTVSGLASAGTISLSSTSIDFGAFITSAPHTIRASNSGTAPVTISALNMAGSNPDQFHATGCVGTSIPAGGNCDITVTFTPASVGNFSAVLNVVSSVGSPSVILTGSAPVDPAFPGFDISTSATTLTVGRSATSTVNLTVNRHAGFTGDIVVTLSSPNPGITADPLTIPAAATTGVLTLHTNSSIETNTYAVSIVGTGAGLSHAVTLSVGVDASITPPPPSAGGGGGCSLGAASASLGLFTWMLGLLPLLALRRRK